MATAGSVDDGKSTLIGRLLYDTDSLSDDKVEAIRKSSEQRGYDYLDFSLATDGLVAEREQGITIDVAHIYFSTPNRSYIIADTPGHIEYTRNMVTGASTSEVAIILIDARKGVVEQTFRHFFINNLLRVKEVIVAVNKMDLVDYSEAIFQQIKTDFQTLNSKSTYAEQKVTYIPVSALKGDNVARGSERMSWYKGESLLQYLESLKAADLHKISKARFPVQMIIRPKTNDFHDFRGYTGKLYGGNLRLGDAVTVLPSMVKTRVSGIYFFDEAFEEAGTGSSLTIVLEDEVNVARGDMIVKSDELPSLEKELQATVCWMEQQPLVQGTKYILQHNTNKVLSRVEQITNKVATDFSGIEASIGGLTLNDIGLVSLKLAKPIYFDRYDSNKENGAFILIDPNTHNTAGVGFIT